MPTEFNKPERKISNISEIWNSNDLNKVRHKHLLNKLDDINICKGNPRYFYMEKNKLKFITEIASTHNGKISVVKNF